jgi:hypothetical protein
MDEIDAIIAACERISEQAAEVSRIKAERRRQRRNERARALYAFRKRQGLPRKAKPEPIPDRDDWEPNECCTCFIVAPCAHCTSAAKGGR